VKAYKLFLSGAYWICLFVVLEPEAEVVVGLLGLCSDITCCSSRVATAPLPRVVSKLLYCPIADCPKYIVCYSYYWYAVRGLRASGIYGIKL
jgi:hypothetical protein